MSNGGMMTYQLAAAHPDWFAAVAPVSATIGGTARSGASFLIDVPARPVSLMIMHGRNDRSIPYAGGVAPNASLPRIWKMSVADALSFWTAADGCPPAPQMSEPVRGKLRRIAFTGCREESEIVHWEIEDGEHAWPDPRFPGPGGKPQSAAAEILSFFAAHSR
jgi:polyhydroxybutyrate depolymerase